MSVVKRATVPVLGAALVAGAVLLALDLPSGRLMRLESEREPRLVVHDDRLTLSLYAEDPMVVTPIGLAVDEKDRLFVLESHTHSPPSDYEGPEHDIVRVLIDLNGDGSADSTWVFAEGIEDGMNLAFAGRGRLIVVSKQIVWELSDTDGDGVADRRQVLLEMLEPENVYDHAGLLSVALSKDGWMYIGRGNTGGSGWRLVGSDGSELSGYGDGGNIIRARLDGSHLAEVATGFWNPFSLSLDSEGRLFALDNDPDSRGPNRLLHIIEGGDYGYKSLYGESGIHPYVAWNGELPGTLPYAAGVGEAPTGLLMADAASLPADYAGGFLAGIWEEKQLVLIRMQPAGHTLVGRPEVIVEGDVFRPIAFAPGSDGSVFITDWVLRRYPNHGRGRIWRLRSVAGTDTLTRREPPDVNAVRPVGQLARVYDESQDLTISEFKELFRSDDPFLRTATVAAMSRPSKRAVLAAAAADADPNVRLGAVIALARSHENDFAAARAFLSDPDPLVRRMALVWIGRETMKELRPDLDRALEGILVSPELFETYLETVRHLQPAFVAAYRGRKQPVSSQIDRPLPARFVESIIEDRSRPPTIRALAIPHLDQVANHSDLLVSILHEDEHPELSLSAVRALASAPSVAAAEALLELALNPERPPILRAEAILALTKQPLAGAGDMMRLLEDADEAVRVEAARYLRSRGRGSELRAGIRSHYERSSRAGDDPVAAQLALMFDDETAPKQPARPDSDREWLSLLLQGGGDPAAGRRVFFSEPATCSQCHAYEGRGGMMGPDLSNVGLSKDRRQIVESILDPSAQISPEWQGWYVQLRSGETVYGRQIDVGNDALEIYTSQDRFMRYQLDDVRAYGVSESSLMPDGLERMLTVSDMRDLIAFLEAAGRGNVVLDRRPTRTSRTGTETP